MVLPLIQDKTRGGKPVGYAMRAYSWRSWFVLLGIAESITIYVTSDLVSLSTHVREQVHD